MQPTTTLRPSLVGLVSAGKTVDQIAATLGTTADQARDALANAGLLDLVEGDHTASTTSSTSSTSSTPSTPSTTPSTSSTPSTPSTTSSTSSTPPRRRGRPPKAAAPAAAAPEPTPAPRRRGRPRKTEAQAAPATPPRRRGRPPKVRDTSTPSSSATSRTASKTTPRVVGRLVGAEAFAALGELAAGALERGVTLEAYVEQVARAYAIATRLDLLS